MGSIGERRFRLRAAIGYRNSFQTIMHGVIEPAESGSRIICRFGMSYFVTTFLCVWFAAAVIGGGAIAILSASILLGLHSRTGNSDPWSGVVIPVVMIAFGVALVSFGRYLARDEQQKILSFLRETLSAEVD